MNQAGMISPGVRRQGANCDIPWNSYDLYQTNGEMYSGPHPHIACRVFDVRAGGGVLVDPEQFGGHRQHEQHDSATISRRLDFLGRSYQDDYSREEPYEGDYSTLFYDERWREVEAKPCALAIDSSYGRGGQYYLQETSTHES
jgi:hypothetical protein